MIKLMKFQGNAKLLKCDGIKVPCNARGSNIRNTAQLDMHIRPKSSLEYQLYKMRHENHVHTSGMTERTGTNSGTDAIWLRTEKTSSIYIFSLCSAFACFISCKIYWYPKVTELPKGKGNGNSKFPNTNSIYKNHASNQLVGVNDPVRSMCMNKTHP